MVTKHTFSTIIFDVDGTLADTEREGHRIAFNQAFRDEGLAWHWSEDLYGALLSVTGGKERIRFFIERYRPNLNHSDAPITDIEDLIVKLHQSKTRYFSKLVTDGAIRARPGVVRLIHEARHAGMKLAIATTSVLENATALLKSILHPDALEWFDVIAAGDVVPQKKPAPDIYHYVLQAMNLSPTECLVIEDSAHGLSAAVQAGLPAIVTVNDYTRTQNFSDAVMVVNHLGDPDHASEAIASSIDISDCLTQQPTPYIDLGALRTIHRQAVQLPTVQ